MKMSVNVCYTSCSSNQTPNSAQWGKNDLICYASCNSVRIYDPKFGSGGKVTQTLCGHTNRVNCVKWISGVDFEHELVSGSSDGTAIVWTLINKTYSSFVLKGHSDVVNLVDGLYKEGGEKCTIVTASIDCSLKVWSRTSSTTGKFYEIQNVSFGHGICMSLKLSFLPQTSTLLLACGMDNSNIQLYVESDQFVLSETLKGHENWVRGLDFLLEEGNDLILASSAQDSLIRLWRIAPIKEELEDSELALNRLKTAEVDFVVSLESILAGHESWVYSVSWNRKDFTLLSASLDKSMIIWEYNKEAGLWLEKIRVGEVGGNTLGFYGGMFGPSGFSILAHGYHGAFHIWNLSKENMWEPAVTIGGHFREVVDLSWEPSGKFLVSLSYDQTTRIHAPWIKNSNEMTYHEIARPQVHGYDMNCLALLSRYRFASGAEEKVIRTFKAPKNFIENFKRICHIPDDVEVDEFDTLSDLGPQGAAVPSLGLSNKAVYENDNAEQAAAKSEKEPYPEESYFTAVELTEPPTEETLLQNTLWPEVQKLYGHGYEVYSLASNREGTLLASACKATSLEHAAILLWETKTWKQIQKLCSHNLTIAQLAFSPDSNYLLSVSRDRRWTLFSKHSNGDQFEIIATSDKKTGIHTRIIWCCAWSSDSLYFATGSRDGKIVIWTKFDKPKQTCLGQYGPASQHLEVKGECITALAFAPIKFLDGYLIAVGLESGVIMFYYWNLKQWTLLSTLGQNDAHHLTVKRLAFRPVSTSAENVRVLQLASCGSDHAVRIYNVDLNKLIYIYSKHLDIIKI